MHKFWHVKLKVTKALVMSTVCLDYFKHFCRVLKTAKHSKRSSFIIVVSLR